jgi:hypothetical protein
MKSLTESLLGKLKLKERVAAQELVAIAKRETANKLADADVKQLEQALHVSGKSVEHYQENVALLQRIKQLEGEAAKLPAASAAVVKAREGLLAYQAETAKLEKARREGQLQLEVARNVDYSKYLTANKAKCALERLQYDHPELFGGETIDLDSLTLTSGDGENLINFRDENAPHREVPEATWQEQSTRRQQIRGAATAESRKEYNDARNAWAAKLPKDYNGHYVSDVPYPKFEMPTWGDILAKGWNRTLDGLQA